MKQCCTLLLAMILSMPFLSGISQANKKTKDSSVNKIDKKAIPGNGFITGFACNEIEDMVKAFPGIQQYDKYQLISTSCISAVRNLMYSYAGEQNKNKTLTIMLFDLDKNEERATVLEEQKTDFASAKNGERKGAVVSNLGFGEFAWCLTSDENEAAEILRTTGKEFSMARFSCLLKSHYIFSMIVTGDRTICTNPEAFNNFIKNYISKAKTTFLK